MKKWKIALTLGIVCCVLTLAISVQIKAIDNANSLNTSNVSLTLTNNDLKDQALKWKEKYDNSLKELEKSETKLEEIRLQAVQNDENSLYKEEQIKIANILLGRTNVKGDGIIITLKDNNEVSPSTIGIEYYLVHAGDLIRVINDLKNAGAEAISVNGQRVIDSTAIYCAGNVVKINDEKITSPIEIKAIGSPELLYGSLTIPGGYLQLMEETGVIVNIEKKSDISINKYEGVIDSQYMKSE